MKLSMFLCIDLYISYIQDSWIFWITQHFSRDVCVCVLIFYSVSSSSILCLSSISSRRRLSCFWWASLWFSSCSSSVFWRTEMDTQTFDCGSFQLWTDIGPTLLTLMPSSPSSLLMSPFSSPDTSCLFSESQQRRQISLLCPVLFFFFIRCFTDFTVKQLCGYLEGVCLVPTLSVQFGELLGQSVLTLLQLPLLLLHILHVVSQRLDLGLVLHTEGTTQTPWTLQQNHSEG